MQLDFEHPTVLTWALAVGGAGLALWIWLLVVPRLRAVVLRRSADKRSRSTRPFTLPLRLLLVAFLLVILAEPVSVRHDFTYRSVIYVVDASASNAESPTVLARFIEDQNSARLDSDDVYGVILCAEGVVTGVPYPTPADVAPEIRWDAPRLGRLESNVAEGMKAARTTLDRSTRGTIVLLSDGHFDRGAALREAHLLRSRGIELEVVEVPCSAPHDVLLQSVLVPSRVHEGVMVRIRSVIENTGPMTDVRTRLILDGEEAKTREMRLEPGTTVEEFEFAADESGTHLVRIEIQSLDGDADEVPENNYRVSQVSVVGDIGMLLVEGKPGNSAYIRDSLLVAQVDVDVGSPADLAASNLTVESYDVVGLVNVPAADLTQPIVNALEEYVHDGGGVVVYGGDRSFDCGLYRGSALEERLLPVTSAEKHPGSDKAVGIFLLLIDISGSMQGTPLEMAKEVGVRALSELRAGMAASVISFDAGVFVVATPEVVTPTSLQTMIQKVNELSSQGGTDILPAMQKAGEALGQARGRPGYESLAAHLILISDGEAGREAELDSQASLLKGRNCTVHTVLIGSHPSDRGERLMSAIAKAGGGRAEKYTGSDTPVFKLKEDEIEEEKARLDFTRHRNDVVFAAQLQAQGFLRRLVWDYNQVELNGSARESLLVRDPARAKSGGPTSTPVYAWHYVGGVNAGRVAVCAIDVDGIWSKGLLESPASNVLLGDPLFFCRRTEKEKLISAALQLDAFQSDEVIVTVWGHLPKNAILNLVPLGNVGRADRDQPVALFPNTPLTYQGRFRRADDRDVYNFDVLEELPDGSSRLLGSVTAVLNPRSRAAEQVPGEPNRAVLESVAAVSDADVKTLTDSIAVPRKGIRVQRDRVWSCAFAWALMALLMAGTLVRLEPPRSLTWTAVVLATGLVLFLGGVFYAIHDAVP